jgi:hypothetical protein
MLNKMPVFDLSVQVFTMLIQVGNTEFQQEMISFFIFTLHTLSSMTLPISYLTLLDKYL